MVLPGTQAWQLVQDGWVALPADDHDPREQFAQLLPNCPAAQMGTSCRGRAELESLGIQSRGGFFPLPQGWQVGEGAVDVPAPDHEPRGARSTENKESFFASENFACYLTKRFI